MKNRAKKRQGRRRWSRKMTTKGFGPKGVMSAAEAEYRAKFMFRNQMYAS